MYVSLFYAMKSLVVLCQVAVVGNVVVTVC